MSNQNEIPKGKPTINACGWHEIESRCRVHTPDGLGWADVTTTVHGDEFEHVATSGSAAGQSVDLYEPDEQAIIDHHADWVGCSSEQLAEAQSRESYERRGGI